MEHIVTVLHISDLHARGPREPESWRRRRVTGKESWCRNLEELQKDGPIDLVCFTGDLALSGRSDEYPRAGEFLAQTLQQLGLPPVRLAVVPGNHDIDRSVKQGAWQTIRSNIHRFDDLEISRWLAGREAPFGFTDDLRDKLLERQSAFRGWLAAAGFHHLLPSRSPHGRLGFRHTLRLPGLPFDVRLIGLDSAWLCGDDSDDGRLRLTTDQVMRLAADSQGNALPGLRIALLHHPLSALADGSRCRRLMAEHVDVLLRGHLHEAEPELWADPERSLRQFVAGCLYEGHQADTSPNGCSLIRMVCDDTGRPRRYDLRFRSFSLRGGHWFDDGSLYRAARSGRLRIELSPPSSPPLRSVAVRTFVGRQSELRRLAAELLPGEEKRTLRPFVVTGLGGMGKSTLAEQFFRQHSDQFPGGLLRLTLPGDGKVPVRAIDLCGQLADQIGMQSDGLPLTEVLQIRLRQPRSLLIIENVDSEATATAVAELAGMFPDCSILITGRLSGLGVSQDWPQLQLASLTESEALELLTAEQHEAHDRRPTEDRRELVRALGFLPLAIQLAAGHLRSGRSAAGFLYLLKSQALDVLPADPADPLRSQSPERVTIRRSFELSIASLRTQLGYDSARLLDGLATFAWLPPVFVSTDLGASVAGLTHQEFELLMFEACRLSIVQTREGGQRYGMHPLMAWAARSPSTERIYRERLDAWFIERLPPTHSGAGPQGPRWESLHAERELLTAWLAQLPIEKAGRVAQIGSEYAQIAGPFLAWAALCERGLAAPAIAADDREALLLLSCIALEKAGQYPQAQQRAQELCAWAHDRGDTELFAMGRDQVAVGLINQGQLQNAVRILRAEVVPVYEKMGSVHKRAIALGRIADILTTQGQLDEALKIREEEVLPIFQELGDMHSVAITQEGIASIHEHRGRLDEALRIRNDVSLPIYDKLGDRIGRAQTIAAIAATSQRRGQLDEALRRYKDEVLPIYEQLGELRLAALTRGQMAEIQQDRGQIDEALRVWKDDLLPFFQKIGDLQAVSDSRAKIVEIYRQKGLLFDANKYLFEYRDLLNKLNLPGLSAFSWGQEARLCRDRGQFDVALRILLNKELPIYEQLGDRSSRAETMGKIADIYQDKEDLDRALEIRQKDEVPFYREQGYRKHLALALGKIAGIRERQGLLPEAQQILEEEVVPVFEALGYQRSYAVALRQLARVYKLQGRVDAAIDLLESKALPLLDRLQIAPALARTRYALAQALLQRDQPGDYERAKGLLADAYAALAPQGFAVAERFRALRLRHGFLKLSILPIREAQIENVRGIASLNLPLHRRLTVLYGRNATGKSTVLDAIALGLTAAGQLLAEQDPPRIFDTTLLRQRWLAGEAASHIEPHCRSTLIAEDIQWTHTLWRRDKQQDPAQTNSATQIATLLERLRPTLNAIHSGQGAWDTLPVFAYYGVERAVDRQVQHAATLQREIQRTEALNGALDAQSRFQDAVNWFYTLEARERKEREERKNPQHRSAALDAVRRVLEQAVPSCRSPRISDAPERLLVDFERADQKVETLDLGQLSDGYRTHLALVLDLARRMVQANPPPPQQQHDFLWGTAVPAIVLIDEVDLHLHPTWQQTVVPGLLSAFPNTQFVITTHSDQVLSSCPLDSLTWELYRDADSIAIRRPAVPLAGASSEQVLEVGMAVPARAEEHEFVKQLKAYEQLVYEGRFGDAEAKELRRQLDAIRHDDPGLMDADAEIARQRIFSGEPEEANTQKPR